MLAGGLQPDDRAQEVRLLLNLRSRGWGWGEAADSVGVDPRAARAWLEDLLLRIRPADSRTSSPVRGDVGGTSGQAKYRDSPVATDGSVQEY